MAKVVATEFVTLDGVMEDPHLWSFPYWGNDIADFKSKELFDSETMLLGRVTYEAFADSWPGRTDETGFADRFNGMPKLVASTTLRDPTWTNSSVIQGPVADEVRRLKQQPGGDITIHGSRTLVNSLLRDGLIDQYNVLTYPLVHGKGKRLFDDGVGANLKLVDCTRFDSGVVALIYAAAG